MRAFFLHLIMMEKGLNIYQRIAWHKQNNDKGLLDNLITDYMSSFENLFIGGDKKLVEGRRNALTGFANTIQSGIDPGDYKKFTNYLIEHPVFDLAKNENLMLNALPALNDLAYQKLIALTGIHRIAAPGESEKLLLALAGQVSDFIRMNFLADSINYEWKVLEENGYAEGIEGDFYHYFIFDITNKPEWISYFFDKYPVLVPPIYHFIENQVKYISSFIAHLSNDAEEIKNIFGLDIPGKVNEISLFNNALRNNNTHVIILNTNENKKLVYKPKNYATEFFFQEIIGVLGALGLAINVKFPIGINRDKYSWVEFVDIKQTQCKSMAEAEEFFFTQGQMLFIFYLFNSYDIGSGNILCFGNQPCFIDLEGLFSRVINFKNDDRLEKAIERKMNLSVSHIGMLPKWSKEDQKQKPKIKGALISTQSHNSHLPFLNNSPMSGENFISQIIGGFETAYTFCSINKLVIDKIITDKLSQEVYLRKILRSSSTYYTMQKQFFNPVNLTDGLKASRIYDHFWAAHGEEDYNGDIVESEIRQLLNSDIPVYAVNTLADILYDGNLVEVSALKFKSDVLTDLKQKLNGLSADDLNFQLNIIKGTFTLLEEQNLLKK